MDPVQTGEALHNVIANASEAMTGGGELTIALYPAKQELVLEVKDTGVGMDKKELSRVMEPFYTTKGSANLNFGLGVPYAYHVMRKHGGSLHISSEKGKGTSVYFIFPKKRILRA
nr:ATP-binding protein [Paenibacillus turpanensis]